MHKWTRHRVDNIGGRSFDSLVLLWIVNEFYIVYTLTPTIVKSGESCRLLSKRGYD